MGFVVTRWIVRWPIWIRLIPVTSSLSGSGRVVKWRCNAFPSGFRAHNEPTTPSAIIGVLERLDRLLFPSSHAISVATITPTAMFVPQNLETASSRSPPDIRRRASSTADCNCSVDTLPYMKNPPDVPYPARGGRTPRSSRIAMVPCSKP